MGVKGESGHQKAKPVATNEQLRLAQLTLEGKSSDDDPIKIQRLIKKVIETTRCSQSQAELALYDNDNDLAAAVDYILEHSSEVESWTELKKKEKKKDDDDRRPFRGQSSSRGRGAYIDRGARVGRGATTPSRGTSRGVSASGSGRGRGAPAGVSRPPKPQESVQRSAFEPDVVEENSDWKNGPMEFKQSTEASSSTAASAPSPVSTVPAPISFAAVAAAAARKEQMRQQQLVAPTPVAAPYVPEPAPVEYSYDEPETSIASDPAAEDSYISEPSVANPVEEIEEVVEEEVTAPPPVPSPTIQANTSWTNQLKSELGIGLTMDNDANTQFSSSVTVQSRAPAPAGVEFATDAAPTGLADYQFGFVDVPSPTPVEIPPAPTHPTSVPSAADSMFSTSRHSSMVPPQKNVESDRLPASDYSMKASPPAGPYGHSGRSLGFGDASSVSYTPAVNDRLQQSAKPSSHMSHNQLPQQQQPQQTQQPQQQNQSHQQPQMQFPPQLPYTSFPYMNMYSPVTGVRADDPYSAALMQYPFGGMGVDLSTMLPGTTPMSQSANTQQMQSNQPHRSDSHNMDGMKYQSQNTREQSQQPSNVAPPPGFANPASFMGQPALSSLFMQQQYPPHPYSFMMPNVGNAGRQMYSQDDERKPYDKMGGAKQAQPTPPPHYHNNGAGYHNIKKQPYNWNINN